MITLITLTQGNVIALKRTIDNVKITFKGYVNQVVVGDLCIFEEDAIKIDTFDVIRVPMPISQLYNNGFASVLNSLSEYSTNDLCLYMNVGEIVETEVNTHTLNKHWNCYAFNHATEPHQWVRLWDKKKLKWSGRIHEEVIGDRHLCPTVIFQMADTEKDKGEPFYEWVMNDIKEMVYFNQYLSLVDKPNEIGATNAGWVDYAKESYQHIKDRLLVKGQRLQAFCDNDNLNYIALAKEDFKANEFENNKLIHFQ